MSKREHHFKKIDEFKERFEKLPTEKLRERISFGSLQREAAIAIRELLEERDGDDSATETIYVALLDEGVDVWRPVEAELLPNGYYRILSKNADYDVETWQFPPGTIVRCEQRKFSNGETALAAVDSPGQSTNPLENDVNC